MLELFITYLLGALVGGTVLVVWITRSIWPHPGIGRSSRAGHRGGGSQARNRRGGARHA